MEIYKIQEGLKNKKKLLLSQHLDPTFLPFSVFLFSTVAITLFIYFTYYIWHITTF